jgi:hypothetical protein
MRASLVGLALFFAGCIVLHSAKADVGADCNGLSFDGTPGGLQIPGCPDRGDRSEYDLPYIGHDEPTVIFYSNEPHSASNLQWEIMLPKENPTPATQSLQNFTAFWFGMPLCDPNSAPFGACAPASDDNDPTTAGAAFLELQFYPPGKDRDIDVFSCSTDKWCVAAVTFSFNRNGTEPFNNAFVQTDGVPIAYPGPSHGHPFAADTPNDKTLLMGQGDRIRITLKDTPHGLRVVIEDLTTRQRGFMLLSAANGFETVDGGGVATPFDFHPLFDTATPQHVAHSAAILGLSFAMEIGHNEQSDGDSDDGACSQGPVVPACYGQDADYDGTSYIHDWPTNRNPNSVKIRSVNGGGIGPLSVSKDGKRYDRVYDRIQFETTANIGNPDCLTNPACDVRVPFPPMVFYPSYALLERDEDDEDDDYHGRRDHREHRDDEICSLVFGDFTDAEDVDSLGGDSQYGEPDIPRNRTQLVSEIQANPCIPDIDRRPARE